MFGGNAFGWPYFGQAYAGHTGGTVIYTLVASPGVFTITGASATLAAARNLNAAPGSYTITGDAATLNLLLGTQFELVAEPGSFTIAGADAGLVIQVTRASAVGVLNIAFTDGPLTAAPVWTRVDQSAADGATGSDGTTPVAFPENFFAGYDITTGRQSLISQTDTGTATVYINDRSGLFDPNNASSPYFGNLIGRQILLQLKNPVTGVWQEQFRGLIDNISYDIDGSAVNANGEPINASIQMECVDVFDYLGGFGLTPGLAGVNPAANGDPPPAGSEDIVYYAASGTGATVEDRVIQILTDAGIDSTMYNTSSGNVQLLAAKYDPDEAALTALRDCADAELPFIANIYVDRHGKFCFRGRYSRFAPDSVSAEPGSTWDFNRWKVGDGAAIQSDSTRAQMRVLSYANSRANIINAAICYPQGLDAVQMPNQVYADTTSITAYGKHTPPGPMSDLLIANRVGGAVDGRTECLNYATLLVKNQKDPREAITALQVKAIDTSDLRASATWDLLTRADISDVVNVKAGYPGGTGITGASTADDYYIEGRQMQVRPANTGYHYVELDLEVSPAEWSMDTHGVFPAFPG